MAEKKKGKSKRKILIALVLLVLAAIPLAAYGWYKFFREVDQPEWITADPRQNFLYGSIGSESAAGIPYWLVVVLPRIFGDDYLPGPGGYASLGMPWEEGMEFPTGFSKKKVGFDRVAFNCALCHSTQYRVSEGDKPVIVAAGGSHTADIQGLLEFFSKSAKDPRFNAETILTEIDLAYQLSWIDRMIYKYLLIPMSRKQLIAQGDDFAWADDLPRWGPGRDAPMNLTKFNFLGLDNDGSVDNTDFPAIWNLKVRVQEGRTWPEDDFSLEADFDKLDIDFDKLMLMNLAGDTTSFNAVLTDSALGLQAQPSDFFTHRMHELEDWLLNVPAPEYPLPIDTAAAETGRELFEAHCAECHATGRDNRMGTIVPLAEVKTDPNRSEAWTLEAANGANEIVAGFGIKRTPMSKPDVPGYTAMQLDGIWLRAPYLHNGAVPTLRALLEPPACRSKVFYRGYDVLDAKHVGFVSQRCDAAPEPPADTSCEAVEVQSGCMPEGEGWRFDTAERGNGNQGHEFGTALTNVEKDALVEYLKTL